MTTTIDASHTTMLKLLARGRSPEWVSDATSTPASKVEEVGRRYGWPDLAQLRANLDGAGIHDPNRPAAIPQRGPAPVPMSTTVPTVRLPAGGSPSSNQNLETSHAGRLELMLARAGKHDTAPVNAARNAVLSAMTRLEGALQKAETKFRESHEKEAAKAAAKARVALLEKQLRDAKAELRGRKLAEKSASEPRSGEDPKVVREWARQNGVICPSHGRVPGAVVEAFRAAATTTEAQTA